MKLNPYNYYEEVKTRRMQIVYLDKIVKLARTKIAEITQLTISTVKTYCSRFKHLLTKAKRTFNDSKHHTNIDNRIIWETIPPEKPCGYVIEFYNKNKLLWLKVGKTTRPLRERIKEHLIYYMKKYPDIRCVVKAIYTTETNEGAEVAESALRECYKKKHLESFIKNDRFAGIPYTGEEKNNERFLSFLNMITAVA